MKNKTKSILIWIPSTIAALLICIVATGKLSRLPQIVTIYSKIGLLPYLTILGAAELIFTTLFLLPRTAKIGFLLLTAYFGGAIAVELSHGAAVVFPAIILTIIWISAYLREPSLFITISNRKNITAV